MTAVSFNHRPGIRDRCVPMHEAFFLVFGLPHDVRVAKRRVLDDAMCIIQLCLK